MLLVNLIGIASVCMFWESKCLRCQRWIEACDDDLICSCENTNARRNKKEKKEYIYIVICFFHTYYENLFLSSLNLNHFKYWRLCPLERTRLVLRPVQLVNPPQPHLPISSGVKRSYWSGGREAESEWSIVSVSSRGFTPRGHLYHAARDDVSCFNLHNESDR